MSRLRQCLSRPAKRTICSSYKRPRRSHVSDKYSILSVSSNMLMSADLESEMYQLSHILIEQRNILATMTDGKTTSNLKADSIEAESSAATEDVENSQATRAVKEMVQGFNGNLEGKTFLNEGALIELDANDYRPIQRVFFFLFNDVLIVCKVKHDK